MSRSTTACSSSPRRRSAISQPVSGAAPGPSRAAAEKAPVPESTDALGVLAYVVFILVGGLLVFAFAWMLQPAVDWQNQAACRPLTPEARSGEAPDIEFQTLDGKPAKLSDFRGKFVVLNFWATWCEPCVREWPELEKLAQRFKEDEDVVVLAVSVDQEPEAIGPFLERMHLSDTLVTVVNDPTGEVNRLFGSEKIPDTFFVDEAGELRAAFINVRDWGRPAAFHCVGSMIGRR